MANLLFSLVAGVAQQSMLDFVRKTRQVEAVQEKFLRSLLRAQQQTELGRAYSLSEIKTIDQFRDRVPILPYSSYEPYIERITQGEKNVLTAAPVLYLNLTSGSTGKQKLIPVTQQSRQAFGRGRQVGIGFVTNALRRRGLPIDKMLLTSSGRALGHTRAGIPYGPSSAGDISFLNLFYHHIFAHPFDTLKISDSVARHYVCLLFALRETRLNMIGATFPIHALRLCDYLECYADELIRDMEQGTIADWLDIEPTLRAKLEKRWSADSTRAHWLRQRLKAEGRLTPKDCWDLSVVVTARGGTSNFYFERFPQYFGNIPIFGGVYAASEAMFGVYHDLDSDGTILSIDSGFYEFIPEDQWDAEQPQTLLPSEVTPGRRYRILVTNYNGLYRYDIGDVVEVLGFYERTPLIVFRHRLGGLLSSTTEKTTEFHATQVMQRLQQTFNLPLENFCITLSDDIPAHYLVNIEIESGHTLDRPQEFLQQFDACLKEIHTNYANKRHEGQVPSPRLRVLEPGSFADVGRRLLERGISEVQMKFPHISEDRTLLAGLGVQQEVRLTEETNLVISN